MLQISIPLSLEFISISYFGTDSVDGVKITKDLETTSRGRMS
jgi:hypoxanthine-guanine phosphoribosyltransferase